MSASRSQSPLHQRSSSSRSLQDYANPVPQLPPSRTESPLRNSTFPHELEAATAQSQNLALGLQHRSTSSSQVDSLGIRRTESPTPNGSFSTHHRSSSSQTLLPAGIPLQTFNSIDSESNLSERRTAKKFYPGSPGHDRTWSTSSQTLLHPTQSRSSQMRESLLYQNLSRASLHAPPPPKESFAHRFLRKGKKKIGIWDSVKTVVLSSWVNLLVVFIPISWVAHFSHDTNHFPYLIIFTFSFLAIVPLQRLLDYGGKQMAYYVGKDVGDLLVVTLSNAVEATLAIILLIKCEIKLLQSTIIGVIMLHLLLVPGTSFITGGARIAQQDLHPHLTQLNHTLLLLGVLSLLLPAAFFSAIDHGSDVATADGASHGVINDETREIFLSMSRGVAFILLFVYVCSRIYVHNPPKSETDHIEVPLSLLDEEDEFMYGDPKISQWVCIPMLFVTLLLMSLTAIFLVESVELIREDGESGIKEEWFGLILLPFVSFAADGAVAVGYFTRYVIQSLRGKEKPPATVARARAIDLSIQFTLFWLPFIVILGWITGRPLTLLFDLYEICILLGSCFLVNYVTQDAKTNWAEGVAMVSFYAMIVLISWWYDGQEEIGQLLKYGVCAVMGGHGSGAESSGSGETGGEH
ncbi:sodium calcium [Moniliophthora roreri MCA 2997]|nr:sodium calcium [Moniliophthora roreri MCA 2997]KAI3596689.1 sodium calcium [Moniliophthora roreri]